MNRFSPNTIQSIQYYVYGLRIPGEQRYFYIGKGRGNRVFAHAQQKIRHGIQDPKFDVIQSIKHLGGPEIDIIRHGLTEDQALLVESALIDVMKVDQITNKVRGHDSEVYGLMSPKNVEAQYCGKPFNKKIKAVCFKINKHWRKNMPEDELYLVVSGNWRLNLNRARQAEVGIGVKDGVIRAIYDILRWEVAEDRSPIRYRFIGVKSQLLERYIGYSLAHHKAHDVRGPLFYLNC